MTREPTSVAVVDRRPADAEQQPERVLNWDAATVTLPGDRPEYLWRFRRSTLWLLGYAADCLHEAIEWHLGADGPSTTTGFKDEAEVMRRLHEARVLYSKVNRDAIESVGGEPVVIDGPSYVLKLVIETCAHDAAEDLRSYVGDDGPVGDGDLVNAQAVVSEIAFWQSFTELRTWKEEA